MRKLSRIIAIILVVVFLMPTTQVLAIADPNTPPQITAVYIFEDLLEDGDLGVLIDYYLDYDPAPGIPTEPVSESYLAAFIDIDGSTQLGASAPYTFQYVGYTDNGYQRGLVWIYFTAAEVTAAGIDSVNQALHTVWLMGNPTVASGWAGVPPKTIAGIDDWQTTGDSGVLLAQTVLGLANALELAWGLDMIETTTLGARLTSIGEAYFPNVINSLREMAPNVFAVSTIDPELEDLDYSTAFGATMTNGTGTFPTHPLTLNEGANNVVITATGTFILELVKGTEGTAASIDATVTGVPPVVLVAGTNTITVTLGVGLNDFLVTVNLVDTASGLGGTVEGTSFDLTVLAAEFGMSRWMFSGIIWLIISVVIVAAAYGVGDRQLGVGTSSGKGMLMVFNLCIIIGTVLGLLHIIVGILLFLGFGFLTAYVLFFRGSSF